MKGTFTTSGSHSCISFETISELLGLLDKLDKFVKVIFSNVRSYGANECRIAALVPLVEESHGIYK
jgi:hypothetical protein